MTFNNVKKFITKAGLIATIGIFNTNVCMADTSVWKVSKGEDQVYIGGTVHILPASEFPLPAEFLTAYQATDTIVLETQLPDPTDTSFQAKLMQQVSYTNDKKLSDKLSDETFKQLETYLAAFGINVNEMNGFKPGFIVMMMAMLEAKRAQLAGEGVDAYFNKMAAKDNKSKEYLESSDFQINLIANMGQGNEEELISSSIAQMSEFKEMFNQLLPAWRAGDSETLSSLVIDQVKDEDPDTFKQMFTDRNQNWIPLIEKMFNDNDKEFVLVGVGHLVGENNVLQLLEQSGYEVTKL
ncbi:TraB/GumN family protein [Thalassotalea sp. 1_MG-2023]|uniref:TraB/GumN family protein n=1 Tax=Thalassotalea sp. 1_MG-2023 TaxID=3062680 RepID=UPI0026E29F4D|nr:TraB/GumN family protein [Thalassotalea sp. 1_MG-2023]MDO6425998.1 TraB/GumN family protein [Thalassotalea sp. 1_MG-2023]